jgi:hypothetical protein
LKEESKQMKFGFDLHGVIDARPEVFAALTSALVEARHEVHILTGPPETPDLIQTLSEMGIRWTHLFSIVDHLRQLDAIGELIEPMWKDERGNWWSNRYDWDRAKGDYCRKAQIDFHLDDSDIYGYFFTTPYARFFSKDSDRVKKIEIPRK